MKQLLVLCIGLLAASIAVPGSAAEPKLLGTFKDWDAFVLGSGPQKQCYIVSMPKTSTPANARHGKVYVMVTHKPARRVVGEVNVLTGYTFKRGSTVSASTGRVTEKMFTSGQEAWAYDPASDRRLVAGMKRGSNLTVRGTSARGTRTTYGFSLFGFTAAYSRITKACG